MINQKQTRRQFLKQLGASTVVLVGGTVWHASNQGVFSAATGPAYEAWTTWKTDEVEGPVAVIKAGLLAASPHNTQPWIFKYTDSQIIVYADTQRHLGAMDPYLREMHLGLGCALENMTLAAEANGFSPELVLVDKTLNLDSAERGVQEIAVINLLPVPPETSELYSAIPKRRTNRFPFTGEKMANTLLDQFSKLNSEPDVKLFLFHAGTAEFDVFHQGTILGAEFITHDEQMSHDSFAWFPKSWAEVQEEKSGPYIDTAGLGLGLRAVVKMVPSLPSQERVDEALITDADAHIASASAVGIIAVRSLYDAGQTLRAGRLWQRMHLWATNQNIAMQPHNEMPEVVDRQAQLKQEPQMAQHLAQITGEPTWYPTFTFRCGIATVDPLPSARRPVEEVLMA